MVNQTPTIIALKAVRKVETIALMEAPGRRPLPLMAIMAATVTWMAALLAATVTLIAARMAATVILRRMLP
jgi:hypothetical protein